MGILIIVIVFSLSILSSILGMYRPFIEWQIRFTNKLNGVSTSITDQTISYRRARNLVMLVPSLLIFIFLIVHFIVKP